MQSRIVPLLALGVIPILSGAACSSEDRDFGGGTNTAGASAAGATAANTGGAAGANTAGAAGSSNASAGTTATGEAGSTAAGGAGGAGQKTCPNGSSIPANGCCTPNDCPLGANAQRTCVDNVCGLKCEADYGDCDTNLANGCEVNLGNGQQKGNINENCGECNHTCSFSNSEDSSCKTQHNYCQDKVCWSQFLYGETPYVCPVEMPHAKVHLADCGGGCYFKCDAGFTDCDNQAKNGCETPEPPPAEASCNTYRYFIF